LEKVNESYETPWGPIGYITYKRTYARRLNDNKADSPTEEFPQTVNRIVKACRTQLKVGFSEQEEEDLTQHLTTLKGSVAGRFWWQLGTKTVSTLGLASLQNCAACVVDEPIRPFTWTMDMLMLGCGVGFNIQKEHVFQIPKVQKKKPKIIRLDDAGADYIVPDSREGWVKLLGKVLKSYFYNGGGFTYSTQLIRGAGAVINGFGGTASGAEILVEGIDYICEVLEGRRGKKLRPVDCLDIMCIIGMIVKAGNVRRSALIAVGDCDDRDYLNAKRWDLGSIPNWRANSNNSVVASSYRELPEDFWEGYKGNGECYGLINLEAARRMGRLGEYQYPDPHVMIFNPCAEQGLDNYETCCLAEIFLCNITSKEELFDVAEKLYRICKHSLRLPCHNKETEEVVHKNMRMGLGITGYEMSTEEQKDWLSDCYTHLRDFDKKYSKEHGWNESIKLTTIKPSGTLSLLPGVTSGGHPAFSEFHIRRIRVAANSNLVEVCKSHGYAAEWARNFDGTDDHSTVIIEFPCKFPKHATFAKDQSAIEQMEVVRRLQKDWSDNAVSVTIYYKLEELDEIREWLDKNYETDVKTMSFLLHSGHGFDQAPLEEITEEEFLDMYSKVTPIVSVEMKESDISEDQIGCEGGICPIK
jgi:ribonucleotide reductase alpha subunit